MLKQGSSSSYCYSSLFRWTYGLLSRKRLWSITVTGYRVNDRNNYTPRPNPILWSRQFSSLPGVATTELPPIYEPIEEDPSLATSFTPLTRVLEERIARGHWRSDPIQTREARKLEALQNVLSGYSNEHVVNYVRQEEQDAEEKRRQANKETSSTQDTQLPKSHHHQQQQEQSASLDSVQNAVAEQLQGQTPPVLSPPPRIPRGLYLYGSVGSGKSALMDAFFDHVRVTNKKRVHFHQFMADVHARIHQLQQHDSNHNANHTKKNGNINPIQQVARQMVVDQGLSLLCLDEFHVTDIADALLLSQFFSILWAHGCVLVATSNQPPAQLYADGLHRQYFLPFIDLLQTHCRVHAMTSPVDYRVVGVLEQDPTAAAEPYFFPANAHNTLHFDRLVNQLRHGRPAAPISLTIGSHQRTFSLRQGDAQEGGVLCASFSELCEQNVGASDYRALAQHFGVVALYDLPVFSLEEQSSLDSARRFVTLLDELYESKSVALLCLTRDAAIQTPHDLFPGRRPSNETTEAKEQQQQDQGSMNAIDQATGSDGRSVAARASVRELSFAFDRAASRMFEMTSRPWWDKVIG